MSPTDNARHAGSAVMRRRWRVRVTNNLSGQVFEQRTFTRLGANRVRRFWKMFGGRYNDPWYSAVVVRHNDGRNCSVNEFSSRVCKLGTKGCVKLHSDRVEEGS